ncbi:hypothetical protein [Rhodococcus aetherivorans]|uniref:phage tail fiber protein n=1 Tax=Rhodococcus aetherivorans TaxID=191292 RepID=UPI00045CC4E2|nr:hypothetical protein [Rhodococcus aetherivorans]KDE14267.1 hypothetical protein N505_0105465 [Rhodococcus aetherivorans]
MAKFTDATRESLATHLSSLGAVLSLHTADPGTTGGSEASGGSYARKTTTWTPGASDGSVAGSEVEFDVPAGTFTHIGCWNTAGTTFLWSQSITSATFGAAAKLRVTPTLNVPQGT